MVLACNTDCGTDTFPPASPERCLGPHHEVGTAQGRTAAPPCHTASRQRHSMSVSKLVCALVSQCEVRKGVFRGVYTRRSLINYLTSRKNVSHGKIRCTTRGISTCPRESRDGQGVFRLGDRGLLADTAGAWCAISEKCKSDPVFGCVVIPAQFYTAE